MLVVVVVVVAVVMPVVLNESNVATQTAEAGVNGGPAAAGAAGGSV